MKSLDPRVNRLDIQEEWDADLGKGTMDQLETFEVFIQTGENKPFGHEGIVHASDEEMAFVFAKEQFSRRGSCTGIMITRTQNVFTSEFSEEDMSVYDRIGPASQIPNTPAGTFEVFHLLRRGKQHQHSGSVDAVTPEDALYQAKMSLDPGKPVYNVWVVHTDHVFATETDIRDIWDTLPEKTFREAGDYRGAEKIKKFKEEQKKGND